MKEKKAISLETYVAIFTVVASFYLLGRIMGIGNLFNTIMNTAHDILLNTVFFIMAMSVVAGSISALMAEFGVISLLNKIISALMRHRYGLPGGAG